MRYHGGGLLGVLESGDFLGSTLAAGDSNNDGNDDLVIGSAGEDVNRAVDAGALNIINGSGSGLNSNSQKQLFHSGGGLTGALESGDYVGGTDPDNIFW